MTTTTNSPKGDEKHSSSLQPLLAGTPTSSVTNASTLTAGITATAATTTTTSTTTGGPGTKQLCVYCQNRNATKDCIERACTQCCRANDNENDNASSSCPKHAAVRAQRKWRQQVLQGQTNEQILAAQIRQLQLPKKNSFRESAFVYSGDTAVIWNVRQYHQGGNLKWRDDARRRAKKRAQISMATAIQTNTHHTCRRRLYCSRKRFRKWVQDKYQEKNGHSEAAPK